MTVTLSNGQVINIAAGATSGMVVATASDDVYLGGDTASVTVTGTTGGNFENLVVDPTAAVTTINDDADTVSISLAGPSSVTEGSTTTDYTVSLTDSGSNPITTIGPVTVSLSYTGTAADGTDFNGVANVVIAAGASTGTFDIDTLTDGIAEGVESFTVTLGAITSGAGDFENLVIDTANDEVTTTIADADSAVLTVDDVVVSEADGTATFTVTLSQAVVGGFSVDYTLSDGTATGGGTDYTSTGGTIVFAGNTGETQTIIVPITDDVLADSGENFTLSLSTINPLVDATDTAIGTITDDVDTASVSIVGPASVVEGETTTNYTISLNETPASNVTVTFTYSGTATDGTDFNGVGGAVILAGNTSATFTLNTLDDAFAEGAENFIVTIDSVTGGDFENVAIDGGANTVTTTINDEVGSDAIPGPEDTALVSIVGPGSVVEGETTTNYTITINETPTSDVTVNFTYSGTAADGTDFTGTASATILAGATSGTFTIDTLDDAFAEGTENFTIAIDSASGGGFENVEADAANDNVITSIVDQTGTDLIPGTEDTVSISLVGPSSVAEGDTTTNYTVSLTDDDGNPISTVNPVTVALSYTGTAADGTDFSGVVNVTIPGGSSSGTFNIATLTDGTAEGLENFTVTLGAITGGAEFENLIVDTANDEVTTNIVDADSAVLTVDDVVVSEADGTATFTVTLSQAVAGGFSVDYTLSDGTATGGGIDYTSTGGTINFAGTAGETQTITVPVTDDVIADGGETFTVSLSTVNPLVDASDTAIGTINDEAAPDVTTVSLAVDTANLTEAGGTIRYTVNLDNPANTDLTVNLDDGSVITVLAGNTSGFIDVNVAADEDAFVDPSTLTRSVVSTSGGNFESLSIDPTTAVTNISDTPDLTTVSLSASNSITEAGGTIIYTATVDNVSNTDLIVTLANGETITILAGNTSGSVNINVAPEDDVYIDSRSISNSIVSTAGGNFESLSIDATQVNTNVTDTLDKITLNLDATSNITEVDGVITYTVTVDQAPVGSDLVVNLSNGETITIAAGTTSGSVDVIAGDDGIDGPHDIVVAISNATGGNFEGLSIEDTATTTIDINTGEEIVPDEIFNADTTPVVAETSDVVVEAPANERNLNADGAVVDAVSDANNLGSIKGLDADGAVVDAVEGTHSLGGVRELSADGAVLDAVEGAGKSSVYFGDLVEDDLADSEGLFDVSGVKGFSVSFNLTELGGGSTGAQDSSLFPLRIGNAEAEAQDQLVVKSLLRDRTIYLEVDYQINTSRDLNAVDYKVTELDGSALPDWLRIDDRGGLVSGEPPIGTEVIQLRVEVTLSDGTVIIRYMAVDVTSGEIAGLEQMDDNFIAGVGLFSNQLNELADSSDESLEALLADLMN